MTTAEMPQAASTPTGQDDTLLEVRGLKMYFPLPPEFCSSAP